MNIPKQPKKLIFFLDHAVGRKIVSGALRAAGEEVRLLSDEFPSDVSDEVWLERIGREGWLAITHDKNIRYRSNELSAVLDNRVRLFVLACKGSLRGEEIASIIIAALPGIKDLAEKSAAPFIAKIYRDGTVRKTI